MIAEETIPQVYREQLLKIILDDNSISLDKDNITIKNTMTRKSAFIGLNNFLLSHHP